MGVLYLRGCSHWTSAVGTRGVPKLDMVGRGHIATPCMPPGHMNSHISSSSGVTCKHEQGFTGGGVEKSGLHADVLCARPRLEYCVLERLARPVRDELI